MTQQPVGYCIYYRVIVQDDEGLYQSNSKIFRSRKSAEEYALTANADRKPIIFEDTARTLARIVTRFIGNNSQEGGAK